MDSQTQQKEPMKAGNLIDIIERSRARRASREERDVNNFHAVIGGAVARFGPDKNGRTDSDWDISFWFAVLSPVFGILAGLLAVFLIYN
ncbi:MAG: hypothetical protein DME98_18165 [Verrucomicrobia bacterium]|nr:MAG: hypothetical protein DME98_18165 [Verrucomicrobiota bacterium]